MSTNLASSESNTAIQCPSTLRNMNGALVSHYFTTGQPGLLAEFVGRMLGKFVLVYHPFSFSNDHSSLVRLYSTGKLVQTGKYRRTHLIGPLDFVLDLALTLRILTQRRDVFDLFIGSNSLNALAGLMLKALGRVHFAIFYSIDLPTKRFRNPVLNLIYHRLDIFCASNCDATWDLSARMDHVRRSYNGGHQVEYPCHLVVPAVYSPRIDRPPRTTERSLFFVGHLREGVDLSVVVRSMQHIRKEVSNACLAIVGTGPKLGELRRLVKDIGLSDAVLFYGPVASDDEVEEIAANSAIGVAPYIPDPTGISATGDSMKLKFYASLGLPSITTDVPLFSSEISRARAGLVVPLDEHEFAHAALKLLKDPRLLSQFSRNAKGLALRYSPEIIFGQAIAQSLTAKI